MNFEDFNTIYEKYKYLSFQYKITMEEILNNEQIDFFTSEVYPNNVIELSINNSFWTGRGEAFPGETGTLTHVDINCPGTQIMVDMYEDGYFIFDFIVDEMYNPSYMIQQSTIRPITTLVFARTLDKAVVDKIYFDNKAGVSQLTAGFISYQGNGDWYLRDLQTVQVQSDSDGDYITTQGLYSATPRDIFYMGKTNGTEYYLGKCVTLPSLPILTGKDVYKGNKNKITIYNKGVEENPDYYEVIYQDKIVDKIYVSEDMEDFEIKVNTHNPEYASTTLPVKLHPVNLFVNTQEELDDAIEEGYDYIEPVNLSLVETEYKNITFANGRLYLAKNIFRNVKFKNIEIVSAQEGANKFYESTFINCEFEDCIFYQGKLNFENSEIRNAEIQQLRMHMAGGLLDGNEILESLIISDTEKLQISNNQFYGAYERESYFPNTLYLTGELNCYNNTFEQTRTVETLSFNMALIKMLDNPQDLDNFVTRNEFDLTTNYDGEEIHDLIYNIVDDDTLRRRAL